MPPAKCPLVRFLPILVASLALAVGCSDDDDPTQPPQESEFAAEVRAAREAESLVALGAAVASSAEVMDFAVGGVRKLGEPAAVQDTDLFCVGSTAKAMTATMIATLVEDGLLAWDDRVVDIIPDVVPTMDSRHAEVALRHLLSHHSGLLAFHDEEIVVVPPELDGDMPTQRHDATVWLLGQPPLTEIDSYDYSNAGYVVAAAMAEAVTRQSYEALMQERLFAPLGITAVTGYPGVDLPDQPWGHDWNGSAYVPVTELNDSIFLPAGGYCMSVGDLAAFARMHLRGLRGEQTLLAPATVARLHTAAYDDGSNYGFGWVVLPELPVSMHDGHVAGFEAFMVVKPETDRVYAFVTNSSFDPFANPEELTPFYRAIMQLLPDEKDGKSRTRVCSSM